MIGRTVLHYTITGELGAGAMGRVYLATDTRTDRRVALKFLATLASAEGRTRLAQEARTAARLSHPGVVTLYGLEESGGEQFLVQEYVEGESLEHRLARGPLGVQETLRLARALTSALAHAHAHGVLHRDLKPANIMVTSDGSYKIADFGIARLEGAPTMTEAGTVLGTLPYLAPECLRGHRGDARGDLFSLGAVLHEAATGRRAFPGATEAEVIYQLVNESPRLELQGAAGTALSSLIGQLLEKEPARRPAGAEVASGILATVEATSARPSLPSRRSWKGPAIVAAAAALLLVAAGFWWSRGRAVDDAHAEPAVAVLYFENLADPQDQEQIGPITGNLLVTSLAQDHRLNVLSTQRILDALRRLGRAGSRVDRGAAMEVARRVRAGRIVTGSILQSRPHLIITAEISDVRTGKVIDAVRVEGQPGESVFQVVDALGRSLLRRIAPAAEAVALQPVATRTSADLEAVRRYIEGLEHFSRGGLKPAQASFEAALARDSTFVQARYHLAITRWWQGEPVDAQSDIARARADAAALSPGEREMMEAISELVHLQWSQATARLEPLERMEPDNKLVTYGLVESYFHSGRRDQAIEAARRTLALDSTFTLAGVHLVDALALTGRVEEAIRTAREMLARNPENLLLWSAYQNTSIIGGDGRGAVRVAEEARKAAGHETAIYLAQTAGLITLNLDGPEAARRFLPGAGAPAFIVRNAGLGFEYVTALRRGQFGRANAIADRAWRIQFPGGAFPGPPIPMADGLEAARWSRDGRRLQARTDSIASRLVQWGGSQLADVRNVIEVENEVRMGRLVQARRDLDRLKSKPIRQIGQPGILEGAETELLIAEGRYAEALAKIGTAGWPGPATFSNTHRRRVHLDILLGTGRNTEALTVIDSLMRAPVLESNQFVLLHLKRGRALEKLGRAEEASRSYREFLALWKDANPGLPEVAEAKAALSRLGTGRS
ncbi:MAG TPA: protein kinase [Candidatus Limnocylindria bacterium]|nr:protein kinase [Candidatus Limnocylindria bacterium]